MLEKEIEKYLCKQVKEKLNGIAYKFTSPGRRAVPDRLCVVKGYCFFVECKATGKYLTDAQQREANRLLDLDQWVCMVSSKGEVNIVIKRWELRLKDEGRL